MNRERTQTAYSSPDLPSGSVAFGWTTDDTVLTIDPTSDLSYAADTVPSTASAKRYSFTIASTATDRAGNALQTEFASNFATSREIAQTLVAQTWQLLVLGASGSHADLLPEGLLTIGDTDDELIWAAVFQFDLSALAPGVQAILSALLRAHQETGEGTPFGNNQLGHIVADHTNFDPIDGNSITAAPLRTLGVFSNSQTPGIRSLDVGMAVTEDHENRLSRSYRSQYRLAFTKRNNGNGTTDQIYFSCSQGTKPELVLKYLIP